MHDRSTPEGPRHRQAPPHEVLGLSHRESDPVKVIQIAQTLLYQWRRLALADADGCVERVGEARLRIRQIIAARQAMLEHIRADCP